ncbi:MAG: hypothetical protein ACR2KK_06445 [Acidimicrobiales bacterium]
MSRPFSALARVGLVSAVCSLVACTASSTSDQARPTTSAPGRVGDGPWTRSDSETFGEGQAAADLSSALGPGEGTPGWLIAGTTSDPDGLHRAMLWRSANALEWTPVELPGGSQSSAFGLGRLPGGRVVVVGRVREGLRSRAAVWLVDGDAVTPVAGGDAFAGDGDGNVAMYSVAAGPVGLVAIGVHEEEGQDQEAAAWSSPDGSTWERVADADAFAADGEASVSEVTATPEGIVAVGSVQRGSDTDGAAWFSVDGRTWAPALGPDFGGPGAQGLNDVVSTPTDLVAVGSRFDGRFQVPTMWRSPDGRSWSPGAGDFELVDLGSDTYGTVVSEVVATTAGLVATGGGPIANRVWSSADGDHWSDVALPPNARDASGFNLGILAAGGDDVLAASSASGIPAVLLLQDGGWKEVTAKPSGFPAPSTFTCCVRLAAAGKRVVAGVHVFQPTTALGGERNDVRVFTSDDGVGWKRAEDRPFVHAALGDVARGPDGGLIAVGGRPFEAAFVDDRPLKFLTWSSNDGSEWIRGEMPPDANPPYSSRTLNSVAVRNDRTVVVGDAFNETDVDGVIFVKDAGGDFRRAVAAPGLAGPEDTQLLTVCGGPSGFVTAGLVEKGGKTDAAVWFSPDGDTWERADGAGITAGGDKVVAGCVATGSGFVMAGNKMKGQAADAAVWRSADGRSWTSVESPVFTGDDSQYIQSLVADGDWMVAVGGDSRTGPSEGAIWTTSDGGSRWQRLTLGPEFRGHNSQSISEVVIAGGRIVVGGSVDDRVVVWSRPWPLDAATKRAKP